MLSILHYIEIRLEGQVRGLLEFVPKARIGQTTALQLLGSETVENSHQNVEADDT